MELQKATEQAESILAEVQDAFYDIPFENSHFQTSRFVLAAQYTPARAYRALGLRMNSKIQAIQELKFGRQLEDIDIDEYHCVLNDTEAKSFEKRRAEVEIAKIESKRLYTDKLLNDAISELNFMYKEFKLYPKYTREQFEAEESEHFEKRLTRQIQQQGNGAIESLAHMEEFPEFVALVDKTLKLESK